MSGYVSAGITPLDKPQVGDVERGATGEPYVSVRLGHEAHIGVRTSAEARALKEAFELAEALLATDEALAESEAS